MPASVRFVLAMLLAGAVATPIAMAFVYGEDARQARVTAEAITGGSVSAGREAFDRYRCGSCHTVKHVDAATGQVGPALDGVALRSTVAGKLENSPDKMMHWLRHPQAVVPGNAMPDQGVTERDARDLSAFLYTLRR